MESVQIGRKSVSFKSVHGVQLVNDEQFDCVVVNRKDETEVRISDSAPADRQLELASRATLMIEHDQAIEYLDDLDLKYTASPIPGVPMLLNRVR